MGTEWLRNADADGDGRGGPHPAQTSMKKRAALEVG